MKHFLIYTNRHKDRELATTERIKSYLLERGQRVTVKLREDGGKSKDGEHPEEDISGEDIPGNDIPGKITGGKITGEKIPLDAECMIVLGGDGTMLQAAREVMRLQIPIVGVNLGTLGYMAQIEPDGLEEALERLICGDYEKECRMMLNGKVIQDGDREEEGWALNDIVISRSGSLQIIKLNIYVNGQFLSAYSADGVIVTTPTGSTGYNLSAGGPLVEPKAKLIMLTPICPHSLNKRSIILSPEDVIEIEIPKGKEGREQTVEANFDGSHVISLGTGDRIRIVKSEKYTEFIQLNQVSFLEVLHKKMSEK